MSNKKNRLGMLVIVFALLLPIVSCASASAKKDSYQIGETGPGGGLIFAAENGTYLECSFGLGNTNYDDAQKIIKKYRGGRKNDWRLPTVDELALIYDNLKPQGLGALTMGKYWSSLPENDDYVWIVDFVTGAKDTYKKSYSGLVRAVRTV